MNSQPFPDWLVSLSLPERIRALLLVYSAVTVNTRQLFLPDMPKGKEQAVINMLHGVNEIHDTLANYLLRYADKEEDWKAQGLNEQLLEIGNQYRVGGSMQATWCAESIRGAKQTEER